MKPEVLFNPLRSSMRQGDLQSAEFHLTRLMKTATAANCLPRLRTEIYLEAVKTHRASDRHSQAEQMCDAAIANIPADARDLLSALKRVRALLFLDAGDATAARNLIEQADDLELVLQGGQSLFAPVNEAEVNIETWLVSTEVAIAQNDLPAAQNFFEKALNRLSADETALRRKRISPFDRKRLEQYYHDLSQMLTLYSSTLSLLSGETTATTHLIELFDLVSEENKIAFLEKKLPNVPLQSRLFCLLGRWNGRASGAPGICHAEARRWAAFGAPEEFNKLIHSDTFQVENATESMGVAVNPETSVFPNSTISNYSSNASTNDDALKVALSAVDRLTGVLQGISGVLPDVKSYMREGAAVDFSKRGWSGHLLDTDLQNFIKNIYELRYTGFMKLAWRNDLYESVIISGKMPEIARSGEAYLYAVQGLVVDAVFKGQVTPNTVEMAQDNFVTIARMCYSIEVANIQPDIIGYVTPDASVSQRTPLIRIGENSLLFLVPELESVAEDSSKTVTFWNMSDEDDDDDDDMDFGEHSFAPSDANVNADPKAEPEAAPEPESQIASLVPIEVDQKEKPVAKPALSDNDDLLEI